MHVVPRTKGDGLRGFFWPRTRYADDAEAQSYAERLAAALPPAGARAPAGARRARVRRAVRAPGSRLPLAPARGGPRTGRGQAATTRLRRDSTAAR